MKKLSILVLISLGLVLGISCSKEKSHPEEEPSVCGMTFKADLSSTKSVFADNESTSLVWTGSERVSVVSFPAAWLPDWESYNESQKFEAVNFVTVDLSNPALATFRSHTERKTYVGGDNGNDNDEYCFIAVTPDVVSFKPVTGEENELFWPAAVANYQENADYGAYQILFDADCAPTDGVHTNTHIYTRGDILNDNSTVSFDNFKPATSMIRFNMATEDGLEYSISRIVIRSKNGAPLSGRAGLMMDGSGVKAWSRLRPSDTNENYSDITLLFREPITVGPTAGDWYHAVVIPGEVSGKITFTAFDENGYRVLYAEKDAPAEGFKVGVRHKVSLTMGEPILPEDALSGQFSISADTKAYIARGNLWAYIKDGVRDESKGRNGWMIAEHQYDIVGMNDYSSFDSYEGLIDLFGFSTPSNDHGIPEISGGSDIAIYSGGGAGWTDCMEAKGWRTITADEGVYLFTGRENAQNLFAYATIYAGSLNTEIKGLMFVPDNWSTPEGCVFKPISEVGFAWDEANSYNADGATIPNASPWEAMEDAGAVFWPAAGVRIGTSVENSLEGIGNNLGAYWSGTPDDHNLEEACLLLFGTQSFSPDGFPRNYGACVRLVRDVTDD